MIRKVFVIFLMITFVFISGCVNSNPSEFEDSLNAENSNKDNIDIGELKRIVKSSIISKFPEAEFENKEYSRNSINKRCGEEWSFDIDKAEYSIPYPRIQVCEGDEIYSIQEIYDAYYDAYISYKDSDDEYLSDVDYIVDTETLDNGETVVFKMRNEKYCERGITLRFPCKDLYVVELISVYSCNENIDNRVKEVANDILRYC